MRGSLVPFCVQYSFSLNGIIKEKSVNHSITEKAVKFTRIKRKAREGFSWFLDLNA